MGALTAHLDPSHSPQVKVHQRIYRKVGQREEKGKRTGSTKVGKKNERYLSLLHPIHSFSGGGFGGGVGRALLAVPLLYVWFAVDIEHGGVEANRSLSLALGLLTGLEVGGVVAGADSTDH